jgi:hypothetical protein
MNQILVRFCRSQIEPINIFKASVSYIYVTVYSALPWSELHGWARLDGWSVRLSISEPRFVHSYRQLVVVFVP